jgi:pimeloyl-ACP methyl ester carboxylesterase
MSATASALLTYRIAGEGPPVVLLNGGMMTFPSWEPVATPLRERYRVLGFDFRGQLLSPGTPPADLAGHARDVVALLEAVGWDSAHFVGASFGAEVSITLAAAVPGRVRSLALLTAMDRETPQFRRGSDAMRAILADVRAGGDRNRFYDALVEDVYSPAHLAAEAPAFEARRAQVVGLPAGWYEGVDGLLAALEGFDLRNSLAAVRAPALVVTAGDDRVMAPERSRALAEALGAETAHHPTAGHGLVAEDPAWVAGVVLEFLARRESLR